MVDGRLLRTDKQFRHLKQRQRETISQWLYEGYRRCWLKAGHEPLPRDTGKIVAAVMEKIEAAGIWIPERGRFANTFSVRSISNKRIVKELG